MTMPGLVVGGTASHVGKTLTTLALLCALKARGLVVRAAKIGPDFIDTSYHAAITGAPVANLDAWMSEPHGETSGLDRLVNRMRHSCPDLPRPDLLVIEGAMGLYDGGARGAASTALTAAMLDLPILLLLDVGGMGQSVAALAEGFLRHRPHWAHWAVNGAPEFAGIVCTRVGGEKHKDLLRDALAMVEEAPLIGLLPREGAPNLPSRHLGLVDASEALPNIDQRELGNWMEENCLLDALLDRIGAPLGRVGAPEIPAARRYFFPPAKPGQKGPLVGIAQDAAFSFCYADLPALLQEMGARTVFFSPLGDAAPPECDGLYFPGGYPELHARALSDNASMPAALRRLATRGLPMYGECGGYMYLMRSLRHEGMEYAMSGILPVRCVMQKRRTALGYRATRALPGWLGDGKKTYWSRGHEFHYGRLDDVAPGDGQESLPVWEMWDSGGASLGAEGCRRGSVAGSWVHLYPEGSRSFWKAWLHLCRNFMSGRTHADSDS
ncbi:MAG: cobyrinate a,c-diamide synthase [Desulfovibrio sp.]|nr:cobyrinate a,c-diamide synthase [Desulfovibrio sp.]